MKNLPPTSASASVSASWLDRWNGEAHFEKEFQMAGQMVKSAIQAIPVPTDTGTDNFLGPTPKGLENLAQGLPWVSRNKRFALKGLEMRTPSGSKLRSLSSPYLVAPSGRTRTGGITQGKPWAMLSWPLRATEWKRPNSFGPCYAKHMRCQLHSQFQLGNTFRDRVLKCRIKH
jgi:hypothetical protein